VAKRKLSRLELQLMEALWTHRQASMCEVQGSFRKKTGRPTRLSRQSVYRLEAKKAVRRVKKVGNFHILEAAITRDAAPDEG